VRRRFLCGLVVAGVLLGAPAGAGAATTPLSSFGSLGPGAGQLNQPTGIAVDSAGTVYVADKYNDRIVEFTAGGSFIRAIGWGVSNITASLQVCTSNCQAGIRGSGAGQLDRPTGISLGPNGVLYVADTYNHRVSEFTPAGVFVGAFGWDVKPATVPGTGLETCTAMTGCKIGTQGSNAGQFMRVRGVAVGPSGTVYVADEQNLRVAEFTEGGSLIRTFGWGVATGNPQPEVCTTSCQIGLNGGGAGELSYPRSIAESGGVLYVADTINNRISEFTPGGSFIRAFGWDVIAGTAPNTALQVCTSAPPGCQSGTYGGGAGQFRYTYGVAVDGADHLYATDTNNHRINEFTTGGSFIQTFGWGVADGNPAFELCSTTCQLGLAGPGSGQMQSPEGVATDCRSALYLADQDNHRIQRFGEPGTALPPCPPPPAGPTGKRAAALKKCKKKHSKKKRKKCRKRAKKLPV
jgi:tripartite motif-containing protein 71